MIANSSVAHQVAKGFRPLFYVVPPSESCFQKLSDVPDYLEQTIPYFVLLILLEAVVSWLQHLPLPSLHDGISSLSAGILFNMWQTVLVGGLELGTYAWVYEHCRLLDLSWDSPWVWWTALIVVDFIFYWFHRMVHEINLFWAAHQVHHSSEYYNLTTALRQPVFQRFASWFLYLPMALAVPPPAYLVHKQFNLLYQFWIHTEVIGHLGPLEFILNTPSHHRVHHGRNPYCIDKNYAGVFIIWDRMFGTFQPEKRKEKIIYGLVHPLNSWNPLWIQVGYFEYLWKRLWQEQGILNKLSVLAKGPGWSPGKPRLGCVEDLPKVSPDEKPYDRPTPGWLDVYCVLHFTIVLVATTILASQQKFLPYMVVLLLVVYFTVSLTSFGLMFECTHYCAVVEVIRLIVLLLTDALLTHAPLTGLPYAMLVGVRVVSVFSLALWTAITLRQMTAKT